MSLHRLDLHYFFLKFLVGEHRLALHFGFVGVDRVDGVIEDPGNFFSIADAHPDESEDAKFGIQELVVFENNAVLFPEIGIKNGNKIGKQFQENFVEADKQFFPFAFGVDVVYDKTDVIKLLGHQLLIDRLFNVFDLVEIIRIDVEVIADVLFLDLICLAQPVIDLLKVLIDDRDQ